MCLRLIAKIILFIVNFVFTLIGLAIIALGVLIILGLNSNEYDWSMIPFNVYIIPYVTIGLGAVVFFIAFCGCCGACTESKCLLITYSVFMAILAAVKIYIAVQLTSKVVEYRYELENIVNQAFADPQFNTTVHLLESALKCCGTTGPDYYDYPEDLVPPTCCENPDQTTTCFKEDAFQIGCTTLIGSEFEKYGSWVGKGFYVIAGAEVLVMLSGGLSPSEARGGIAK